jgi:opacity protein-like surface antigen
MKTLIFFLVVFSMNIYLAQGNNSSSLFSNVAVGIYGGINISNDSKTGGTFILDLKPELTHNFNMNLALGYSKSFAGDSYSVKSYSINTINGIQFYYAHQYNVNEKSYDIIPLYLGVQYIFKQNTLSPYFLFNLGYNFIIDTKYFKSPTVSISYPSLEDIPNEYKIKNIEDNPSNSFGILVGLGTELNISSKLGLDIRYFYKYDTKIINTHNLIIGITF